MSNKKEAVTNSTPWLGIMVFVLAVLKLAGVINVTWLVVFAPIILWLGIVLLLLVVILVVYIVIVIYEKFTK